MVMMTTDPIREYPLAGPAATASVRRRARPMKMHLLSGGRCGCAGASFSRPRITSETFELPVSSVLLRHPQGNVLFDTGCHPSVATNARRAGAR
jgi:hypothetical protein